MPLQETLKHLKTGLAQSGGSLDPGVHKVLFEPIKHLWLAWALTLNAISPPCHLVGASPLPLCVWYLFILGSNILLSMVV